MTTERGLPADARGREKSLRRLATFAALAIVASGGGLAFSQMESSGFEWQLPHGFPVPRVPPDNPMSMDKVRLGRFLFYDTRMSINGTQSCATCHRQQFAFTDSKPVAMGATSEPHMRSTMTLVNVAYSAALTWNNPALHLLEKQALTPMFSQKPVEMGLHDPGTEYVQVLHSDAAYRDLFPRAFPGEADPFTIANVTKAIACFERTIISARSPWDRFHSGNDPNAISDSAKRGEVLFFSDPVAGCFRCHGGFNFSDAVDYEGNPSAAVPFHNTGLYNLSGLLSYPEPNVGIYEYTKKKEDIGRFRAPTLRNIALTAPYMHDGSIATLEAVLDHYAAGGRTIAEGHFKGIGHDNPNLDKLVRPLPLTAQNRADLIAFLKSLTDEEVVRDSRFSDPRPYQPNRGQ